MKRTHPVEAMHRMNYRSLRAIIEDGRLMLRYEPRFDVVGGAVVGAHATVLCRNAFGGWEESHQLQLLARAAGLSSDFAAWTYEEALKQCMHWQMNDVHWEVSLEISAEQLRDNRYCKGLLTTLSGLGFRPDRLTLELDAIDLERSRGGACGYFERLIKIGVRVSIHGKEWLDVDRLVSPGMRVNEVKLSGRAHQHLKQSGIDASSLRSLLSARQTDPVRISAAEVDSYGDYRERQAAGFDLAQGRHFCLPMQGDALLRLYQESLPRSGSVASGGRAEMDARRWIPAFRRFRR